MEGALVDGGLTDAEQSEDEDEPLGREKREESPREPGVIRGGRRRQRTRISVREPSMMGSSRCSSL